jgi:hypothetical protein
VVCASQIRTFSVKDIANTAFGFKGHGDIVLLRIYLDASGKNESSVLTVGGVVAEDELCRKMEAEWNQALIDAGYCEPDGSPGIFHLAKFGTQSCKYGTGEWSVENQRVPLILRLASIANQAANLIISFSIETALFREFLEASPIKQLYGPEYFSPVALMAFGFVEQAVDEFKHTLNPVAYVFEKGDRQHEINHAFAEYESVHPELENLRSIAFVPKGLALLQMADLVCGKVYQVLHRAHTALGFLDNGQDMARLDTFSRYYSRDGTSDALLRDSGNTAVHSCWVLNKKHFEDTDRNLSTLIAERKTNKLLWIPK